MAGSGRRDLGRSALDLCTGAQTQGRECAHVELREVGDMTNDTEPQEERLGLGRRVLRLLRYVLFGRPKDNPPCPAPPAVPHEPRPGEFFDPVPGTWDDTTTDQTLSAGPALVQVGRLGPKSYRMLRHVGYRDRKTGTIWVVPRDLDGWTLNFSSAPTLVNWIIPVLGNHFNAFILHDAQVESRTYTGPGAQGRDYFGPKVSRVSADRIARDAMGEHGTGLIRRWIVWVGIMLGTVYSKEGLGAGRNRWGHIVWFSSYMVLLLALGVWSTMEVFGWTDAFPWMEGERWPTRLALGAVGAIATPLILSLITVRFWRHWLFGLLAGWLLAVLLPALIVTAGLTFIYIQAERVARRLGKTRENECTLDPSAFD